MLVFKFRSLFPPVAVFLSCSLGILSAFLVATGDRSETRTVQEAAPASMGFISFVGRLFFAAIFILAAAEKYVSLRALLDSAPCCFHRASSRSAASRHSPPVLAHLRPKFDGFFVEVLPLVFVVTASLPRAPAWQDIC